MNPSERYIHFFSELTPESLSQLDTVFTADARFKDPFNDVRGIDAIRQVFRHMYATTQDSRFVVTANAEQGETLFLRWDYHFKTLKGQAWMIPGTSVVRFNAEGMAVEHVDFWDPAENLYEKISLLGWLMRLIKGRLSSSR